MSWKTLRASVSAVRGDIEELGKTAVAVRDSVKASISEMKAAQRSSASSGLEQGYAGSLYELWQQICAADANSPALNALEIQLRRLTRADISWMSQVKTAARKAQQKKKAATKPRDRTQFSGALDEGEFGSIMNQYVGH